MAKTVQEIQVLIVKFFEDHDVDFEQYVGIQKDVANQLGVEYDATFRAAWDNTSFYQSGADFVRASDPISGSFPDLSSGNMCKRLRESGWYVGDGKVTNGGYRPARDGGGYVDFIVRAEGVVQVVEGCPAYHGTIAYPLEVK